MSGHSRWATIKRKKGAIDAKRGKMFTKVVRELTTAARIGGGDHTANPRLRAAIAAARSVGMPTDTVTRAIKKGTGELEGPPVEDVTYEGYAKGGVAIIVEAQTENRNRTSAEVRNAFTKCQGNLGAPNSVAYMFHKVGQFSFDADRYTETEIMEAALEAGADDVISEGGSLVVRCDPKLFSQVADAFDQKQLGYALAELTMVPDNTQPVGGADADAVLKLVERLEDLDDVQNVYANFEIDDAELERIASSA